MGKYCTSQRENLDIDTNAKIRSNKLKSEETNEMFLELFE